MLSIGDMIVFGNVFALGPEWEVRSGIARSGNLGHLCSCECRIASGEPAISPGREREQMPFAALGAG